MRAPRLSNVLENPQLYALLAGVAYAAYEQRPESALLAATLSLLLLAGLFLERAEAAGRLSRAARLAVLAWIPAFARHALLVQPFDPFNELAFSVLGLSGAALIVYTAVTLHAFLAPLPREKTGWAKPIYSHRF